MKKNKRLEAAIAYSIKVTPKVKTPKAPAKLTDEESKWIRSVYAKIETEGGCMKKEATELLSTLTGISIGPRVVGVARPVDIVPGIVVVPLENPNGHNYPLGVPCLLLARKHDCAVKADTGEPGNHLPTKYVGGKLVISCCRPASPKEIREFYNSPKVREWFE